MLEVTWQKHRDLESGAEHPWSSLSAAPKDAPPSPGLQRDPGQPQALSALHSPKPHCCSRVPHFPTCMEMTQARSKMMELEAVRCLPSLKASGEWRCSGRFYQTKDFTQPGNSLEAKGSFPPQSPLLWMSS